MSSDTGEQVTLDAAWAGAQPAAGPDADDAPDQGPDTRTRRCTATCARYTATEDQEAEWTQGPEPRPAAEPPKPKGVCQHCGVTVTATMRRVWGDNAGFLWHCPDCTGDMASLAQGAGAKPGWDPDGYASAQAREREMADAAEEQL